MGFGRDALVEGEVGVAFVIDKVKVEAGDDAVAEVGIAGEIGWGDAAAVEGAVEGVADSEETDGHEGICCSDSSAMDVCYQHERG